MKIYLVNIDYSFMGATFSNKKQAQRLCDNPGIFRGESMAGIWPDSAILKRAPFDRSEKELPSAEFFQLTLGCFGFEIKDAQWCLPILSRFGELLPVKIGRFRRSPGFIFNCTHFLDAFDEQADGVPDRKKGQFGDIKKFSFFPDKIVKPCLFRISHTPDLILAASDFGDNDEVDFVSAYLKSGARGLTFVKVWEL